MANSGIWWKAKSLPFKQATAAYGDATAGIPLQIDSDSLMIVKKSDTLFRHGFHLTTLHSIITLLLIILFHTAI